MKFNLATLFILFSAIFLFGFTASTDNTVPASTAVKAKGEVKWLTFEEAVLQQQKKPKKLLIDIYTDWCGYCKKMDKNTYSDPIVAAYINEHYYPVKFNAEDKQPVKFKDRTFVFKPEYKSHELAISLLNGKMSYPSTVFLDEQMNMIQPLPGYLEAKEFGTILRYFGENAHKKMSWEQYSKKASS
jgi:thioredoxin-related protein